MRCPVCGKENRSGARFCGYCGSPLDSSRNIGKEKCEYLKSVRDRIAKQNNIPYVSSPCTNTEPCAGICPACEAETAMLREMLEKKRAEGNTIVYGNDAWEALSSSGDTIQQTSFHDKWSGTEQTSFHDKWSGTEQTSFHNKWSGREQTSLHGIRDNMEVGPMRHMHGIMAHKKLGNVQVIMDDKELGHMVGPTEQIRRTDEQETEPLPGIPADPKWRERPSDEELHPKKDSFLQKIKKAFGK